MESDVPIDDAEDLGAFIRRARKAAGLTQDDLAEFVDADRVYVGRVSGARKADAWPASSASFTGSVTTWSSVLGADGPTPKRHLAAGSAVTPMAEQLDVWFNGTLAAHLERKDASEAPTLTYTTDAAARWGVGTGVLSIRLPVRDESWSADAVAPLLAGLLPEGAVRDLLFRQAKLDDRDVFGFLRAFGADCAGALSIVPAGDPPPPDAFAASDIDWLSDAALSALVAELPRSPLAAFTHGGQVKLSLAGTQAKLVLVRGDDGALGLPLHGHPSTHLLKPQGPDVATEGLIVVEAFSLLLADRSGLVVPAVEVLQVGGRPALLVKRYDRHVEGGHVQRLHQEDLCQASGRPPTLKYEQQGGLGWRAAAGILERVSDQLFVDQTNLLRLAVFNTTIENGDGHAKNLSFLHTPTHNLRLSPAYDLACSTVFIPGDRSAMAVNGNYEFSTVARDDLIVEAGRWRLPARRAARIIDDTLGRIGVGIETVLREAEAAEWGEPVLGLVADTVRRNLARLSTS